MIYLTFSYLNFLSLNHFRGTHTYEELEGMKSFDDIKSNLNNASDYIKLLKYYLFNFEKIIEKKKNSKNVNLNRLLKYFFFSSSFSETRFCIKRLLCTGK